MPKPKRKHKAIEVLICTHNRASLLAKTLKSINESIKPNNFDLKMIVVANACNDNTIELVQSYQKETKEKRLIPVKLVTEDKIGKSNGLNSAIPNLSCPIIAFVDDDHRVDKNYFSAIVKSIQSYPETDFFCGRILPDWDGSEPSWVRDEGPFKIYPLPVPKFDLGTSTKRLGCGQAVPGGGNLIVKREILNKVGLFSSQLGPSGHDLGGSEDYDWVNRALSKGLILQYIPEITQYHYVDQKRFKLKYLMEKAFKRSKTVARLKHGELPGKYKIRYGATNLLVYLSRTIIFLHSSTKRRYYLVRLSASAGELLGYIGF
ncbi:glycosyltransferase [Desulfospira joergensenii]|uniref:glycosyltransferase n=1 Tax=Desulfospira joergensenii TaxID=53329 RepID=UPI0003B605C9|nr:glycosyltransferase family 2 protein [Desulfospira joergensenii]